MPRFLSDPENVVREEEIIDSALEGTLDHAISLLESYRVAGRNDITIEKESDHGGGYYLMVKWWRELTPEEVAQQERDVQ